MGTMCSKGASVAPGVSSEEGKDVSKAGSDVKPENVSVGTEDEGKGDDQSAIARQTSPVVPDDGKKDGSNDKKGLATAGEDEIGEQPPSAGTSPTSKGSFAERKAASQFRQALRSRRGESKVSSVGSVSDVVSGVLGGEFDHLMEHRGALKGLKLNPKFVPSAQSDAALTEASVSEGVHGTEKSNGAEDDDDDDDEGVEDLLAPSAEERSENLRKEFQGARMLEVENLDSHFQRKGLKGLRLKRDSNGRKSSGSSGSTASGFGWDDEQDQIKNLLKRGAFGELGASKSSKGKMDKRSGEDEEGSDEDDEDLVDDWLGEGNATKEKGGGFKDLGSNSSGSEDEEVEEGVDGAFGGGGGGGLEDGGGGVSSSQNIRRGGGGGGGLVESGSSAGSEMSDVVDALEEDGAFGKDEAELAAEEKEKAKRAGAEVPAPKRARSSVPADMENDAVLAEAWKNLRALMAAFRKAKVAKEWQRTFLDSLVHEKIEAPAYLVRMGDMGDRFYILTKCEGAQVVVTRPLDPEVLADPRKRRRLEGRLMPAGADAPVPGVEEVLTHLYEGHSFGERSLLKDEPRNANIRIVAKTAVEVAYISKDKFTPIMQRAPAFRKWVEELSKEKEEAQRARMALLEADEDFVTPEVRRSEAKVTTLRRKLKRTPDGKILVDSYVLDQLLGRGSFGSVFRGVHATHGKVYAVKVIDKKELRKKLLGKTDDEFLREVAVMKRLQHKHCVALYEVIDAPQGGIFFMVQEFMEVGDVLAGYGDNQPMPIPLARRYFRHVLSGLDYLHFQGVCHRDIKPENILITAAEEDSSSTTATSTPTSTITTSTSGDGAIAKLADFGEAAIVGVPPRRQIDVQGTPMFQPPEVLRMEEAGADSDDEEMDRTYDGFAFDIWSLGVTLYNMVTGRVPFNAGNKKELIRMVVYEDVPMDDLPPAVDADPSLKNLLRGMLHKDPTRRLSMAEICNHDWVTNEGLQPFHRPNYTYLDLAAHLAEDLRGLGGTGAAADREQEALRRAHAKTKVSSSELEPAADPFYWVRGARGHGHGHGNENDKASPRSSIAMPHGRSSAAGLAPGVARLQSEAAAEAEVAIARRVREKQRMLLEGHTNLTDVDRDLLLDQGRFVIVAERARLIMWATEIDKRGNYVGIEDSNDEASAASYLGADKLPPMAAGGQKLGPSRLGSGSVTGTQLAGWMVGRDDRTAITSGTGTIHGSPATSKVDDTNDDSDGSKSNSKSNSNSNSNSKSKPTKIPSQPANFDHTQKTSREDSGEYDDENEDGEVDEEVRRQLRATSGTATDARQRLMTTDMSMAISVDGQRRQVFTSPKGLDLRSDSDGIGKPRPMRLETEHEVDDEEEGLESRDMHQGSASSREQSHTPTTGTGTTYTFAQPVDGQNLRLTGASLAMERRPGLQPPARAPKDRDLTETSEDHNGSGKRRSAASVTFAPHLQASAGSRWGGVPLNSRPSATGFSRDSGNTGTDDETTSVLSTHPVLDEEESEFLAQSRPLERKSDFLMVTAGLSAMRSAQGTRRHKHFLFLSHGTSLSGVTGRIPPLRVRRLNSEQQQQQQQQQRKSTSTSTDNVPTPKRGVGPSTGLSPPPSGLSGGGDKAAASAAPTTDKVNGAEFSFEHADLTRLDSRALRTDGSSSDLSSVVHAGETDAVPASTAATSPRDAPADVPRRSVSGPIVAGLGGARHMAPSSGATSTTTTSMTSGDAQSMVSGSMAMDQMGGSKRGGASEAGGGNGSDPSESVPAAKRAFSSVLDDVGALDRALGLEDQDSGEDMTAQDAMLPLSDEEETSFLAALPLCVGPDTAAPAVPLNSRPGQKDQKGVRALSRRRPEADEGADADLLVPAFSPCVPPAAGRGYRLGVVWGQGEEMGARHSMEDRIIAVDDAWERLGSPAGREDALGLFAVFDGHGGADASEFMRRRLPRLMLAHPAWSGDARTRGDMASVARNAAALAAEDEVDAPPVATDWVAGVLVDASHAADLEWRHFALAGGHRGAGSTGCAVLLRRMPDGSTILYCSNVGDSRAYLSRAGEAVPLSRDHSLASKGGAPANVTERRRIAATGAPVVNGRLYSFLAVARAFGDIPCKDHAVQAAQNDPDPIVIPRGSADEDEAAEMELSKADGNPDLVSRLPSSGWGAAWRGCLEGHGRRYWRSRDAPAAPCSVSSTPAYDAAAWIQDPSGVVGYGFDAVHPRVWGKPPPEEDALIATPEVRAVRLTNEDELVIVACDGVWDVMTGQQAVNFVRRALAKHRDPRLAARQLVRQAMRLHTTDNVSAVVIVRQQKALSKAELGELAHPAPVDEDLLETDLAPSSAPPSIPDKRARSSSGSSSSSSSSSSGDDLGSAVGDDDLDIM